jgi:hypothetical protein
MTNVLDIIHRIRLIKTHNVSEIGTSSIYWAQQNRCILPDGDRLQFPKRRVF